MTTHRKSDLAAAGRSLKLVQEELSDAVAQARAMRAEGAQLRRGAVAYRAAKALRGKVA